MNNLELPPPYYRQINNATNINNYFRPKAYDRNIYTASVHVITVILIWMSMLQTDWFQIDLGICKSYLAIKQFVPEIPFARDTSDGVGNGSEYGPDEPYHGHFVIDGHSTAFCPTIGNV